MTIHHEVCDVEPCLTIMQNVHKDGWCEVDLQWPMTKPFPDIGDVLAIHSEDHSIRLFLWIRNVQLKESDGATKTCRLRLSVGTRSVQHPVTATSP